MRRRLLGVWIWFLCVAVAYGDPEIDAWREYRSLLTSGTVTENWESARGGFRAGAFHYRRVWYLGSTPSLLSNQRAKLAAAVLPPPGERAKAWWVNAYNFLTLCDVLERWPTDRVENSRSAFTLGGRPAPWSLDEIEAKMIRPMNDPRLHFALFRGAVGGGRVPREILHSTTVEASLDALTRDALANPIMLRPSPEGTRVRLSQLFVWYEKDFAVDPWRSGERFVRHFASNLAPGVSLVADLPFDPRLNTPENVLARLEQIAREYPHLGLRRKTAERTTDSSLPAKAPVKPAAMETPRE